MSSTHTRLLVLNLGGSGSYRSCQRRGLTSQEETRFFTVKHSRCQELDSAFSEKRSSFEHHTHDETLHPLAAAAKYDEHQMQYAAEFLCEGAMNALVVCAVCCCCCLVLCSS